LSFLPPSLIGGDLHWLFDFVVKDAVMRFSRVPVAAVIDGETFDYTGGLEFAEEFADAIDPFGSSPSERTVEISLHASLIVDVANQIMKGYDLAAARGKLWLYEANTETAVLFVDGVVRGVEFGGIEEPVSFSLEEVMADDAGLFPPLTARIDASTWPNHAETARGERYPWVFGQPGLHYDTADGNVDYGYASPAYLVDTTGGAQVLLIAGHHVEAGQVRLLCEGAQKNLVTVTNTHDGLGNPCATCEVGSTGSGGAGAAEDDDTFFVKWHTQGGGVMHPDGSLMSGAGDVLRYMLGFSRMRIDHGRVAAAIPMLNQFRIDTAIVCAPDKRFTPWAWIEDHLTGLLPVSWRISPGAQGGFYPVVWRFDATSHDAVAKIRASAEVHGADNLSLHSELVAPNAYREGRASFSSRSEVANEFTLEYQSDLKDGAAWARKTLTGDLALVEKDEAATANLYCHTSRTRYRGADGLPQTVSIDLKSDLIWEPATAAMVLSWLSRKHAIQSVFVSYVVDAEAACNLEPGDVVLVTDTELQFTEYLFMVESITWRSDRFLSLDLRSLVDAARDMAGAEGEEH